jgi:hypothetical protein
MIKVSFVKTESRKRDKKRKRILLSIGERKIHITSDEALKLAESLLKAITTSNNHRVQ